MTKEKEFDDGELISQVRLRGLRPSQLFKADELKEDPDFSKIIKAEVDYQLWLENKKIEEEIKKYEKEEIEKMEKENELIPGPQPKESEKKEEQKKESDDNELIPDINDDSDSSTEDDNSSDLIPD